MWDKLNKTKSIFLANISHEFRTPLNSILGFSDILSSKITDETLLNQLSLIRSNGNSLLNLINDILDLSKIEAGKIELNYESFSIRKLLKEMHNIFLLKTEEKNIDFKIIIEDNLPDIIILDELRLRQILFNLIGNAVKYTQNGFVNIRVLFKTNKDASIHLSFIIKDSGRGIPSNKLQEIFIMFQKISKQMDKNIESTGLGLSISKNLAIIMNGNIRVKSKLGKGSTFFLVFPKVQTNNNSFHSELKEASMDSNYIHSSNLNPGNLFLIPQEIKNYFSKELSEASITSSFEEIENFALYLQKLGKTYQIQDFSKFGQELEEYTKTFDLDRIKSILYKLKQYSNL